jgi:hypothetical protein
VKKRKEIIWCEAEYDSFYLGRSGKLREVGLNGRLIGTFVVTHRWPARVRGEGMVQIKATVDGDGREWRGRWSPNGGVAGYSNRVVIRPVE